VPVSDGRAFVFPTTDRNGPVRVTTLRQFVTELESAGTPALEPYLRRGDFSRWIGEVFGDYALAAVLRTFEQRHRTIPTADTVAEMVEQVRARYDLTAE
jgi:hypothetical protein